MRPSATLTRPRAIVAVCLLSTLVLYGLSVSSAFPSTLASIAKKGDVETADYLRALAARLLVIGLAGWAIIQRGTWRLTDRAPRSSAQDLAKLRILTAFVLLVSTCWEHLPSLALVPDAARTPHGLSKLLYLIPGYGLLTHSALGLAILQSATIAALTAALVGWHSRVSAGLSALLYFAVAGLLREPSWPYHTGLIPIYLMAVLAFSRCGDAYSIDHWRSHRSPSEGERATYGWATFVWFSVLTLPYVEAGLSKLCNAGVLWWEPTNMRAILYMDSLNPMEFNFDLGLHLASAPDVLFAFLGIAGMFSEIAMALVFFSPLARRILPLAMIGMHVGILALQNILFFDLIFLLTAFYLVPWPTLELRTRATSPSRGRLLPSAPRWALALFTVMFVSWTFAIELFPLTAMQMYAKRRDAQVEYYRLLAEVDGRSIGEYDPTEIVPAVRDARYRRILRNCFEEQPQACDSFLATLHHELGTQRTGAEHRLIVEHRIWDFQQDPDDPAYGEAVNVRRYPSEGRASR